MGVVKQWALPFLFAVERDGDGSDVFHQVAHKRPNTRTTRRFVYQNGLSEGPKSGECCIFEKVYIRRKKSVFAHIKKLASRIIET